MRQRSSLLAALTGAALAVVVVVRHRRRRRLAATPRVVIVFSGKRKSGKDYCSDLLLALFDDGVAEIGRLSGPLKRAYADDHGLSYEALLDATDYKERYRRDMIRWGEARRAADPGYFARRVLAAVSSPVLVVSDARRPTDVAFFRERVETVITVRVRASDETRAARDWVFTPGIDDAESECGLDAVPFWDVVIDNEPDRQVQTEQALADLAARAAGIATS